MFFFLYRDSLEFDVLRYLCFTETEYDNDTLNKNKFKNNNLRIADFVIQVHTRTYNILVL